VEITLKLLIVHGTAPIWITCRFFCNIVLIRCSYCSSLISTLLFWKVKHYLITLEYNNIFIFVEWLYLNSQKYVQYQLEKKTICHLQISIVVKLFKSAILIRDKSVKVFSHCWICTKMLTDKNLEKLKYKLKV